MKKYSPLLIAVLLVISLMTVAGWVFGIEFLKLPVGRGGVMDPVTAGCLSLTCISFLLYREANRYTWFPVLGTVIAIGLVVFGALRLMTIRDIILPVDFFAFADHLLAKKGQEPINPMGSTADFTFILTGSALLLSRSKREVLRDLGTYITFLVFTGPMITCGGYLYWVNVNSDLVKSLNMSWQAAICFVFAAVALFYENNESGFMKIISARNTGGKLARTVLPLGVFAPIILGYFVLFIASKTAFSVEAGLAVLVTLIITAFILGLAFVANALNVSDEARRRSEELYHKMVLEVQDYSIILLDVQGNIINWNIGAEKIKGYRAEEIVGKNFSIFYPKEACDNHLPEQHLQLALKNGRAEDEGWRIKKDGSAFWASVSLTALHDDKNNIIGISKVTRDLTERRNSELELEQQAALIQMVPDGIIYGDADNRVISLNKGAEATFEITSQEAAGKRVEELVSINVIGGNLETLRKEFIEKGYLRQEIELTRPGGKKIIALATVKRFDNLKNRGPGWVSIYTDISPLRLNDELKTANNYLEQLAFISAHDIKSPIDTLSGLTDLLLESESLMPEDTRILKMQQEVTRQLKLTNAALNEILKLRRGLLSRDITGGDRLPLSAIIDRAISTLQPELERTGARLEVRLNDAGGVQFPYFYLQSVFYNLMANSIKYRDPGRQPVITFEAKKVNAETINFVMADNGIGFDIGPNKSKLFGIFKRFHSRIEGTGVGLHIVKSIVDAYGGEINVMSEVDKGTTFEISLKHPNGGH